MARNSTPLKVVEKATDKNKSAALDAALSQIDVPLVKIRS